MKTDGMVTGFIAAKTKGTDGIESVLKDNRGNSTPTNKKDVEAIKYTLTLSSHTTATTPPKTPKTDVT